MKTMKTLKSFGIATVVTCLTVSAFAQNYGTDILHYQVRSVMTNDGVEPAAAGVVIATENKQGRANNEEVNIELTGLDTNTIYALMSLKDNSTNYENVAFFISTNGDASFDYASVNGRTPKRKTALPDGLTPVSTVREIDLFNLGSGNSQPILAADLRSPGFLRYQIKRNLTTNSIPALLKIQANNTRTIFSLAAMRLARSTPYYLAFNGDIVQTNTTSSNGRLAINRLNNPPDDILSVQTVELLDTNNTVVVGTTLP